MPIALDISWQGRSASDFSRVFAAAARVRSFKPVLKEIASEVIGPSIEKDFSVGGRPPWVPLAQSTVRKKSRQGAASPSKILVHSGAMAQAASDHRKYKINRDTLRAAPFKIRYWGYHQVGDGVPQRVIMMLQAADRSEITRIFANYIRTFMVFDPRKAGGRQFTGGGLP
ncbi:hypothetical protein LCGC14_0901610 [marine sediment metagenome]|uniref:Phage virion morphogenesis protein n=1 Tax=marine sediment metagenome TaxID=412755 RepID=A0A0F9P192_9ZZZZ